MRQFLQKLWCSLNYRYCMSSAYLAAQRGDMVACSDFQSRALDWERDYIMAGRSLV